MTLVAQSIGRDDMERAKRFATSSLAFTMIVSVALSAGIAIFARPLLGLLGARGEALELARTYLVTVMPGFALLAGAITASFALRGAGDPTRAMYITLIAAVVNGILDPVFIFVFGGLRHPPPLNDITPLDTKRKLLAILCFALLFILGTPRPFG